MTNFGFHGRYAASTALSPPSSALRRSPGSHHLRLRPSNLSGDTFWGRMLPLGDGEIHGQTTDR